MFEGRSRLHTPFCARRLCLSQVKLRLKVQQAHLPSVDPIVVSRSLLLSGYLKLERRLLGLGQVLHRSALEA